MGKESKKTSKIRSEGFFQTYLSDSVIDIGGGNDPVVEHAEIFDLPQGDAQHIRKYREANSYHCVYSSHCLEHMHNAQLAISQWWDLVETNGYMIIVVPHEDLYEQNFWPSIFNKGHCATFRLKSQDSCPSPVSYDIYELAKALPNAKILDFEVQDLGYDYGLCGKKFRKIAHIIYRWRLRKNAIKRALSKALYPLLYTKIFLSEASGKPIDQTAGGTLAQIQIILQKTNP